MLPIILVASIVSQQPAKLPTPADIAFAQFVDTWAAPHPVLSPRVQRLGRTNWREREAAHKALSEAIRAGDRGAFHEVLAGERASDPEIQTRCGLILAELCRCPETHVPGYYGTIDCARCGGTGDLRFCGVDDDGRPIRRELFRPVGVPQAVERAPDL